MALVTLEKCEDDALKAMTDDLPVPTVEPSDHRREHRNGRVSKLDANPVLRAFVIARFDRLTFAEIETEVRDQFPKEQWVGKSSIHRWWSRNYE